LGQQVVPQHPLGQHVVQHAGQAPQHFAPQHLAVLLVAGAAAIAVMPAKANTIVDKYFFIYKYLY
jgi:hypothetical protein